MGQYSDDVELWRRLQAGDEEAFGSLFDRYGDSVYRFCFRRTGSWSVAEDLTSTVFLETWRKRFNVEVGDAGLLPWLLGVAANVVRNQRRSLWRYRSVLKRIPPIDAERDFAEDLEARVDAEREVAEILRHLRNVPQPERDVLALLSEGLTPREIAAALSIPEATVRTRTHRLRRRLENFHRANGSTNAVESTVEGNLYG